jgi:hypothetical protein
MFIALLIWMALEMPTKVKASGQWSYCQAQEFQQCTQSAEQQVNQCATACSYGDPNGNVYCWEEASEYCYYDQNDNYVCEEGSSPVCEQTNQPSCMSYCVNTLNSAIANCFSYYCTPE